MTTETRNEAAERLVPREYDDTNWEECPLCGDDGIAGEMRAKLIKWFAAERRATVERIRDRLFLATRLNDQLIGVNLVQKWLDEEASR